jgi:LacI family transcriptional regulator
MTVGALQTLGERGVRIPADLSLVGYDDMEWWTLTHPPLTTVGQPVYDLGREAMRLLLAQIEEYGSRRPQRVILKPELLTRESCGPPPPTPSSAPQRSAGLVRRERARR